MMNSCNLIGRLTKNPELKTTTSGKTVCSASIAVKKFGSDEALFVNFEAWGKTAEYISNYGEKGRLMAISGKLDCRKWEKDGVNREMYLVKVDEASYLDKVQSNDKPSSEAEYDPYADE